MNQKNPKKKFSLKPEVFLSVFQLYILETVGKHFVKQVNLHTQ